MDEIDSIGSARIESGSGGDSEVQRTMLELLNQLDGFEATKKLREWEDNMRPGVRQPICALTAAHVDDFERSELMKFKDAGLDVFESIH